MIGNDILKGNNLFEMEVIFNYLNAVHEIILNSMYIARDLKCTVPSKNIISMCSTRYKKSNFQIIMLSFDKERKKKRPQKSFFWRLQSV